MATKPNLLFIGNGSMSGALAKVLSEKYDKIVIWGNDPKKVELCQSLRQNKNYLPEVDFPDNVQFSSDTNILEKETFLAIICGVPTQFIRSVFAKFKEPKSQIPVVSLSKGFEIQTMLRPTQIISSVWKNQKLLFALSGPAQAEEVARHLPCSQVLAGDNDENMLIHLQNDLSVSTVRIYTSKDLLGVESAGALKNIIGIATGISDGLKFGDNAKAALITRSLAELMRYGSHIGAKAETFMGLAGIGDVITTCVSPYGRNYQLGKKLGAGMALKDILQQTSKVAEGIYTCKAIVENTQNKKIDLPVATEVYNILYNGKLPLQGVKDLLARELKPEY